MRRPKILKVISVVMVVAMLMLSATGALAATTYSVDTTSTKVTISGVIEGVIPNTSSVTIRILKPGITEAQAQALLESAAWSTDMFIAADSAIVGEGGAFEAVLALPAGASTGEYTAIIGANATLSEEDRVIKIAYVNPDERLAALRLTVNEADDAESLKEVVEIYKDQLGIDKELWDSLAGKTDSEGNDLQEKAAEAIAKELIDLKNDGVANVTIDDLPEVLDSINSAAYVQAVASGSVDDLSDIGDYVDGIDDALDIVESGDISPAGLKKIDAAIIGSDLTDADDLAEEYNKQVFINSVTNPKDGNAMLSRSYLENAAKNFPEFSAASLAAYNNLSDLQKQNVANACKGANVGTIGELSNVFAAAVAANTPAVTGGGAQGGAGGAGGGGGSSTTPSSTVTVTTPTPTPTATPVYERYTDIGHVSWAWDAIEALSERNIVSGYGDRLFGPDNSILREEFIKIVVVGLYGENAINPNAVSSFSDAQSDWYAPYVKAAEDFNITEGIGDGLFGTGYEITRQDMALMLYRMLRDNGLDVETTPYEFTDVDQIAPYAADAVYALKNMNIIQGDDDGSFRPEGSTTRAEAAVLLYKTLKALGKIIY